MSHKYKVGLIAGAFDLIHPGYIRLFEDAKRNVCEKLVIALQIDPSLERPKTKYKPIFSAMERKEILMAIRYVDDVYFYETENDLVLLLLEISPDVRILGSDYVGRPVTGKMSIPIHYHQRNHDWSLTKLRKLIEGKKP